MFINIQSIHNDPPRPSLQMYPGAPSGMMDHWREPVKDWLLVIVTTKIDTEKNRLDRAAWGLFRDRRPDSSEDPYLGF